LPSSSDVSSSEYSSSVSSSEHSARYNKTSMPRSATYSLIFYLHSLLLKMPVNSSFFKLAGFIFITYSTKSLTADFLASWFQMKCCNWESCCPTLLSTACMTSPYSFFFMRQSDRLRYRTLVQVLMKSINSDVDLLIRLSFTSTCWMVPLQLSRALNKWPRPSLIPFWYTSIFWSVRCSAKTADRA